MTDLVPEKRYAITDFRAIKGQFGEKLNLVVYDEDDSIEFYITIGDDYLQFFENPAYVVAMKKKSLAIYLVYHRTVGKKHIYEIQLEDDVAPLP